MFTETIDGLEVCSDCAGWIANGELPTDDAQDCYAAIRAADEREAGWIWVLACHGGECEGGFSWAPCDYCRRPLGGDRHPAAIVLRARR